MITRQMLRDSIFLARRNNPESPLIFLIVQVASSLTDTFKTVSPNEAIDYVEAEIKGMIEELDRTIHDETDG